MSWKFYLNSEEAWDGMYEACSEAKSSIDFEQFIFTNDAVGERFAGLFIRKAAEGVRVRLLCDTAGSYFFFLSSMVPRLKQAGVEVKFFNEISPWRITKLRIWFLRDHRKLLVIDREAAFVGGVGIAEKLKDWRDTHVRISGPVISELQNTFDHMWWITNREKFSRYKDSLQTGDGFTVLTNAPHFRQRFINRTLLDTIRNAKYSVYVTTPYFVPDARFFRVLRLAARRGVDVKILVPQASDHPYVDFASNFYFARALKSGLKIYQYVPGMIHSKTIVIDDDWASVGSANIDNLSTFVNYEILLAGHDKQFVQELKNHFLTDLTQSKQVEMAQWMNRSFIQKTLEFFCMPFGRFF